MKITDATHLNERINCECTRIEGSLELFYRVHVNLSQMLFVIS